MNTGIRSPNWPAFGISCLTHVLLLAPTIYIIVLVADLGYSLFIWHPTCMVVGVGLLMAEAILSVSGEATLSSNVSRSNRVYSHQLLHVLGLLLLVVGFGAVVANKIRNGANHFTSNHGKIGITVVVLSVVVALGGFMPKLLSPKVSLATTKLIHVCGGIIAMILLYAAIITGLYSFWWPGTDLGRSLTVAAYVIGGFLTLARPLYTSLLRIRGLFV